MGDIVKGHIESALGEKRCRGGEDLLSISHRVSSKRPRLCHRLALHGHSQ
jgi:hypothetical protein